MTDPVKPSTESTKTLEFIAPSDLSSGYEFFVDGGDNSSYKVRVPDGGVKSGQQFQALVVSDAIIKGNHNIPNGRWRDGLCDCCALGCCHPVCCLTYWCVCCSLGQVLTRMKMNWFGGATRNGIAPRPSACVVMAIISLLSVVLSVIWLAIYITGLNCTSNVISSPYQSSYTNYGYYDDDKYTNPYKSGSTYSTTSACNSKHNWAVTMFYVTNLLFVIYLVVATMLLRNNLRKKYAIPGNGCEDCCCAWWCMSCVICQTHRHTADFRVYPASCCQCCSADGLAAGAPEVV